MMEVIQCCRILPQESLVKKELIFSESDKNSRTAQRICFVEIGVARCCKKIGQFVNNPNCRRVPPFSKKNYQCTIEKNG
jgi:hypothetical protein